MERIGKLRLYVERTRDAALARFASQISGELREHMKKGTAVLLLSSGGSVLRVLEHISPEIIAPYLTVGIVDERYDSTNRFSNYAALCKTTFYARAVAGGLRLIDTRTQPKQSQTALRDWYRDELKKWVKEHPQGVIIATMGIAVDGHTAGLIPYPEDSQKFNELFDGEEWIVSYDAGNKNPYPLRITATPTFFKKVDSAYVYMVGKQKGDALRNVVSGDALHEVPGRIIKSLRKGNIYIDEELMVASGLART